MTDRCSSPLINARFVEVSGSDAGDFFNTHMHQSIMRHNLSPAKYALIIRKSNPTIPTKVGQVVKRKSQQKLINIQ